MQCVVASWGLDLTLANPGCPCTSSPTASACLSQCLDTGSWELTDVPPQRQQQRQVLRPPGRHSHIAGAYEHQGVILFGGAGLRGPLNDVWLFHCPTASWRCLSEELAEDESPAAREMAAGTMISDAGLLVHGGRAADGSLLDDLCIFDGRAGRWVLVQQTGFPRCAHTACNAAVAAAAQAQAPQPASSSGGGGSEGGAAGPAAQQEGQGAAAAAAAEAEVGSEAASRGAGSAPAPPPASNVLLYGGFTGETVASDLLQLSFLRQQRSSGESARKGGRTAGRSLTALSCQVLTSTAVARQLQAVPFQPLAPAPPFVHLQGPTGCEQSCGRCGRQRMQRRSRALRTQGQCCRRQGLQRWWWWVV